MLYNCITIQLTKFNSCMHGFQLFAIYLDAPGGIRGLNASNITYHSINLIWLPPEATEDSGEIEIDYYKLSVNPSPQGGICMGGTCCITSSMTAAFVSGLVLNATYIFNVVAVNCFKEGQSTNESMLTISLLAHGEVTFERIMPS